MRQNTLTEKRSYLSDSINGNPGEKFMGRAFKIRNAVVR